MSATSEQSRQYYKNNRAVIRLKEKHFRRTHVPQSVLEDSRKSDRKKGRENDLDIGFVISQLCLPCSYCGDIDLRKTLDRIDNSLGHIKLNVVVACERCNYVRRNMPYKAWLVLAPSMRAAREQGLFEAWVGNIHVREPLEPIPNKTLPPHGTLARYQKCGPPRCQLCKDAMASWKRGRRSAS